MLKNSEKRGESYRRVQALVIQTLPADTSS
jgi:hypothetical protein